MTADDLSVRADEVALLALAQLGLIADLAEALVGSGYFQKISMAIAAAMAGMRPMVALMARIADSGWTGLGTAWVADR